MNYQYQAELWLFNNAVAGISYTIISLLIILGWRIRWRFVPVFTMFMLSGGAHHLIHALPAWIMPAVYLTSVKIIVDSVMTSISGLTAILIFQDWIKQKSE